PGYGLARLEGGQHAISAVELAASRLAVDVRPDQQWRELRLTTLKRQEQVCGGVDRWFEANAFRPCHQRGSGLDLFHGESQTTDTARARRAEFGKIHQTLPKAVPIDPLIDPSDHFSFLSALPGHAA